jgi:hypothetical protein
MPKTGGEKSYTLPTGREDLAHSDTRGRGVIFAVPIHKLVMFGCFHPLAVATQITKNPKKTVDNLGKSLRARSD